jgi:hypothetical protein
MSFALSVLCRHDRSNIRVLAHQGNLLVMARDARPGDEVALGASMKLARAREN